VLWVARRWCEIVYGAPPVLLSVLGQESAMFDARPTVATVVDAGCA